VQEQTDSSIQGICPLLHAEFLQEDFTRHLDVCHLGDDHHHHNGSMDTAKGLQEVDVIIFLRRLNIGVSQDPNESGSFATSSPRSKDAEMLISAISFTPSRNPAKGRPCDPSAADLTVVLTVVLTVAALTADQTVANVLLREAKAPLRPRVILLRLERLLVFGELGQGLH